MHTLLLGQAAPPAGVQGKVLDQARAPIAGALITAAPEGGGASSRTRTGPSGDFALPLAPGAYSLRVAADGFEETVLAVKLGADALPPLTVTLPVAVRKFAVTVTETADYQALGSASTRIATPLHDTPQSISVVTRDLIRDQAMLSLADVVRYVPGVTMAQGEGHRDAPVIRGNVTTADMFVNGVRDDVQYYRDLYNVERVEAVKGANALTFGRGGGGGVINRVTKEARRSPLQEFTLQGGSFGNKRLTADLGQDWSDRLSVRLNGLYENSNSFRHGVNLERYGVAPALLYKPGERTAIRVGYEHFNDARTVDRGIPSYRGAPLSIHRATFFGDPRRNQAAATVDSGSVSLEQQLGAFTLRNVTLAAGYGKFYQNIVPGNVDAGLTQVSLSAYNNATGRRNVFNQTDFSGSFATGRFRHTLLLGAEYGRQSTENFKNTGYFGSTATAVSVPLSNTIYTGPLTFRQSAADADNDAVNHVAAVFAQDVLELNRRLQLVGGLRFDRFDIRFANHRNADQLRRTDGMVSPRAGLVFKPATALSLYTSYSVAHLPSAGDQFSALTATAQTLKPERFDNYEAGAKWNATRSLAFTMAVYRLDRTNTTARDPNNPARLLQTGSQRSAGVELEANGNVTRRWRIVGGYAGQNAYITSTTTAAPRGARVALVPRHTVSVWNHYRVTSRLSAGLGLVGQGAMYTGIDNTVRPPRFVRTDAALFYALAEHVRLQANVENLLNRSYFPTAHVNNNILPGSPLAARAGLQFSF